MITLDQLNQSYPITYAMIFNNDGIKRITKAIDNHFTIAEDGAYYEDCFGDMFIGATLSKQSHGEQGGEPDETVEVIDHYHISVEVWDADGELCLEAAKLFENRLNNVS